MALQVLSNSLVLFCAAGALTSIAAYVSVARRTRRAAKRTADQGASTHPVPMTFLLQGDRIVDATPAARAAIGTTPPGQSGRDHLVERLAPRFPGLARSLDGIADRGHVDLAATDGAARIEADWLGDRIRLQLFQAESGETLEPPDGHQFAALLRELDALRAIAEKVPVPIWRAGRDGGITWANAAYLDLSNRAAGPESREAWPPPALFSGLSETADPLSGRRLAVRPDAEDAELWFRCQGVPDGDEVVFAAIPEDSAVKSERTLQSFTQTLTSTFAHLTAGLAIFDGQRRLSLFNPALTELIGLPVDYLARRPAFEAFLDRLREDRITPEPKDYRSWRRQLSALESAAEDGCYSENWPLADGRTFRVTGRPHHDGGLAFVFEDITSEITLSRSFRTELETSQAVLDRIPEAIAVFSETGVMTIANQAYCDLWQDDPMASVGTAASFLEATRRWHASCVPTPVWGDARDFAAGFGERSDWQAEVRHRDGRRLFCRFEPLPGRRNAGGLYRG